MHERRFHFCERNFDFWLPHNFYFFLLFCKLAKKICACGQQLKLHDIQQGALLHRRQHLFEMVEKQSFQSIKNIYAEAVSNRSLNQS